MDWKNILSRAGWAAAAAFVGSFTVPMVLTDIVAWKLALSAGAVAAVGALFSTIKTIIVEQVALRKV